MTVLTRSYLRSLCVQVWGGRGTLQRGRERWEKGRVAITAVELGHTRYLLDVQTEPPYLRVGEKDKGPAGPSWPWFSL